MRLFLIIFLILSSSLLWSKKGAEKKSLPVLSDLRIDPETVEPSTVNEKRDFKTVEIKRRMLVPDCKERELNNKIYFLGFERCKHCQAAKPIIQEIIKKEKLEDYFYSLDLTKEEGKIFMSDKKLDIYKTPTIIFNCRAYIGLYEKSFYQKLVYYFKEEIKRLKASKKQ